MTAPAFTPSSALTAAFPRQARQQVSIRLAFIRERKAARLAAAVRPVEEPKGFRARMLRDQAGRIVWRGRTAANGVATLHAFTTVSAVDLDTLGTGSMILLAKRYGADAFAEIAGIEAIECENRNRLAAWIERAAAVPGIELQVCRSAGSRIERAAIVADLTDRPARASAFVVAGRFDRRAIMIAAVAQAKAARIATGAAWAACLSAALRDVWQAAKAARLATAH